MNTYEFLSYLSSLDIQVIVEGDRLRCNAPKGILTPELSIELRDRKVEIISFLRGANLTSSVSFSSTDLVNILRPHPLPLSYAQQRLWFLAEFETDSTFYNIPAAIRLTGSLNVTALEQSLNEIVHRHEALRTNFVVLNGQPVQVITSNLRLALPVVYLQYLPESEREIESQRLATEEAQQPFNLATEALLRTTLLKLTETEHVLLLTMHHIVSDGWSMGVFVKELAALYEAFCDNLPSPLPKLPIQYADFAIWQRQWLQKEVRSSQLAYWKQRLKGAPALLELPTDRPRPAIRSFRGAHQSFTLPKELSEALAKLSQQQGVTPFMTLLAAFQTLLYRYTGQTDILVGTPIANRNRAEIEKLIGFFVNTLVLRTDISDNPSFEQLLSRVRKVALGAYAHQDLPFEQLVEELQPKRDLSYMPLFQVMFALQNAPMPSQSLRGLTLNPSAVENFTAKFDLTLDMTETEHGLKGSWEYNTDLFDVNTIARMAGHFQTLLEGIVVNLQQQVSELPLLTKAEQHQLLVEWNNTSADYPHDPCIHQLFEVQVERSPDAVAVVFEDQQLTYRELNARANKLAHYLQTLGVEPEVLVGICIERSLEMVVGLLGILKAGGAYVPLDPSYPSDRLAFILEDTQVRVVLTQQELVESLSLHQASLICLDTNWEIIAQQSKENPISSVGSNNLAYTIYTSGSTGIPKGVAIEHRSVVALSAWAEEVFTAEDFAGVLASTSICFDLSVFELFVTLSWGGKVILAENALHLPTLPAAEEVTLINTVPSAIAELLRLNAIPPSVRTVNLAGEALHNQLVQQIYQQDTIERVFNLYGPSEDTTYSTFSLVKKGDLTVTIGRPISNTQVYLLDSQLQPVPIGVSGELYIGGDGLARGYLNSADLTQEKFILDPFSNQPNARLYKTGDLARYLLDGNIEFLGRIDHQVKIRGFRIELGEIEAVLSQHSAVRETTVVAREDVPGDRRLVAYIALNAERVSGEVSLPLQKLQDEQVSHWQMIYNEAYSQTATDRDPTFNIMGWNSSYTDQPIPAEQLRDWVNNQVGQILALKPNRVLEIGCGTGLLLFRIAPYCSKYWGTDFSARSLDYIQQQSVLQPLTQVKLLQKMANDFEGVEPQAFDAVILNSVVQYFPSIEYLMQVIEGAVQALAPGGFIFIGDVRSLPLLKAFHSSVQLYRAEPHLTREQLQQRVQMHLFEETELVIDPAFFSALKHRFGQISHVQIQLMRGHHQNELTQFRYNAILQVGEPTPQPTAKISWLNWYENNLVLSKVRQLLVETSKDILGIANVPNGRTITAVKTAEWLSGAGDWKTAGRMRQALQEMQDLEVNPEDWYALGEELGYRVNTSWSNASTEGSYDVVFVRCPSEPKQVPPSYLEERKTARGNLRPWRTYGNNPLQASAARMQASAARKLVPQIQAYLKEKLAEYMVPSNFVILEALPLTPNGKLDRQALPAPEGRSEWLSPLLAPRTPIEEMLTFIWADILRVEQVGIHDNFFELGGHSLLATQVIAQIRNTISVEIPLRSLFEQPTVAELAEGIQLAIQQGQQLTAPPLRPIARDGELPLSFAQTRLWFLDQLQPNSAFYNIPVALHLVGQLNVVALQASINEIIHRHEALRTNFIARDGQPVQVIAATRSLTLEVIDLQSQPEASRELETQQLATEEAQRPFNLGQEPLVRAKLVQLSQTEYVLLLMMHHIVSDGWSMGVLVRELAVLYPAFSNGQPSPLPELPIQYADFAAWQRQWLTDEVLESQLTYWQKQLDGAPTLLKLPTDRPRPAIQSFRGAHQQIAIPVELSQALRLLSRQQGVTLFMTLLAAFQTLLYRYTNCDDICLGTPIANRLYQEIEGLIGFFVNTLVLRTDLSGNPSFAELLSRVRSVALGAYAHQDIPFEQLVEALQPERSLSHTLLFQVMFALQNAPMSALDLTGLSVSPLTGETDTAKFDLTLSMSETALGLVGLWEYNTDLFDAGTITRMAGHFQTLLAGIVANPHQKLSELPLLSKAERQQLLVEWNNTQADYPKDKCIHQLFEEQVERTPDAVAVVFEESQLTYRELNSRANKLAHYLRKLGVKPDTLVGIYVERSLEMVVGVLGILKAGGAYVPLDPAYPEQRISFMLSDANVSVLLTQKGLIKSLNEHKTILELDTDWEKIDRENQNNPVSVVTPENLLYVIFTSGSTGRAKGVAVEHQQLINYLHGIQQRLFFTTGANFALISTFAADLGNTVLFPSLCSGGCLHVLSTERTSDPNALLDYCQKHPIDYLKIVPSHLAALLSCSHPEKILPQQGLILGGEASSWDLIETIKQYAPSCQIFNHYGPTETTVGVLTYRVDSRPMKNHTQNVPLGYPLPNTQIYLLDRNLQPVPIGVSGEVHISGQALARGYLNCPDLTAERFIPNPFSNEPNSRLYKTGDLARYLPNGNIEYIGRIDNQVKIRGFRIELGEIEAVLNQHPQVQTTTVIVREYLPEEKRLVAYVVPNSHQTTDKLLRQFLKQQLPEYMVPSHFVMLEALPLTPNGKVDRKALPATEGHSEAKLEFRAGRTPIEEMLTFIWADILKVEQVGIHNNFFDLGGHSLLATRVISRIRDVFFVELPLRFLFEFPTVAELSQLIEAACYQNPSLIGPPIQSVSRSVDFPLSFSQQRLWFLDQLEGGSKIYNVPAVLSLIGPLDIIVLEQVIAEIVRRHEVLRTNFSIVNGLAVQTIAPSPTLALPVLDLQMLLEVEKSAQVQRLVAQETQKPFDLAYGSLLRVTLLRLGAEEHILLLTMHHIVSDGWSRAIFIQDLVTIYKAFSKGEPSPLPDLPIQYADFAYWQHQWLQGEVLETQLKYWRQQLSGAPSVLNLPTDRPRPPIQTFRGSTKHFEISPDLTQQLNTLSKQSGSTLFMTLLAAFAILLSRYSSQEDIVVGSPIANRNRSEIESLIGFFVNSLVLRINLKGNPSFSELLSRVRQIALEAYSYQDLPFEQVVEVINPERNLSHNPLFQVMFILQNAPMGKLDLPGMTITPLEMDNATSLFDLTLSMSESEQKLIGSWEYNIDLFDAATITRMAQNFETLLEAIVANPELPVTLLPLLTEAEQHQLLVEWNNTQAEYTQYKCIHQLFEAQVERTPDAVAVVFEEEQLSYQELNCRANQLAHHLKALGVGPEVLVGICVERSLEMVVGLLGILKAGGAYVPLDPAYPKERLAYMLNDSQVLVLLTQEKLMPRLPEYRAQILYLDTDWGVIGEKSEKNSLSGVKPENLAFVIYTSGSTGQPKGVMIQHQSLLSYIETVIIEWGINVRDRVLQFASISFDAAAEEIYPCLICGGKLVLRTDDMLSSIPTFLQKCREFQITLLDLPTAYWHQLTSELTTSNLALPESLRLVIIGGERALPEPLRMWHRYVGEHGILLINVYGPTEATLVATMYKFPASASIDTVLQEVPIGCPIRNVQTYILDQYLQTAPVGVPGELHIGGIGLARGYLNRPDLTAEKFISNPFSNEPGARLYKTGDLARYLPDGNIEYIGRVDNQVKIRGFRIELGEIEAVLSQHPEVRDTVVIAQEDQLGNKRLIAYVVCQYEPLTPGKIRSFLKERLPDYMIPSAFVILDEMPLTLNGKVDLRALPAPNISERNLEVGFVSPRDTLELQLAQIWSNILGVDSIGIRDNFFDLGGHSLLAIQLMAQIKQETGKNLLLTTLFQGPTIEQQANLLRQQATDSQSWSPLVALQPNGLKPPLFCIPGAGGNIIYFYDLARYLGSDQPFYGLQALGIDGESEPYIHVEDMAAYYIEAIQAVQSQGPYFLAGHSFGGYVAFEMAQQLQQQGHKVALLVIIDIEAPVIANQLIDHDWDNATWLTKIASTIEPIIGKQLEVSYDVLQTLDPDAQLNYFKKQLELNNVLPTDAGIKPVRGLVQVFKANYQAHYVPQQFYPTSITLVRASNVNLEKVVIDNHFSDVSNDSAWGWGNFSDHSVDVHFVPGSHVTMMLKPHVKALATLLQTRIEQAQKRQEK